MTDERPRFDRAPRRGPFGRWLFVLSALMLLPCSVTPGVSSAEEPHIAAESPWGIATANASNISPPGGIGVIGSTLVYDSSNGILYVANSSNNSILVVNASTQRLIAPRISVPPDPSAMAVDTDNGCLYVVTEGDGPWSGVSVVDLATDQIVPTHILVGSGSHSIAFDSRNGMIYVSNAATNNVSVVNDTTNKLIGPAIWIPYPGALAFDPRTGDLYVGAGAYLDQGGGVINTSTNVAIAQKSGAAGMWDVAYDAQNNNLYGDYESGQFVAVINDSTEEVADTIRDRASGPYDVVAPDHSGSVVFGSQVMDVANDSFTEPFLPIYVADGGYDPTTGWLFGWGAALPNGEAPIIGLNFTAPVPFHFVETGLPLGTLWTVVLDNADYWDQALGADYITTVGNHSYNRTLTVTDWYGTYAYSVTAAGGPPAPGPGTITVDASNASTSVLFGPFQYGVSLLAEGLPPGTAWNATVVGGPGPPSATIGASSSANSTTVQLGNGSYSVVAYASDGYRLATQHVPVTVNGTSRRVTLYFFPAPKAPMGLPIPPIVDVALVVGLAGLVVGVSAIVLLLRSRAPPRAVARRRS